MNPLQEAKRRAAEQLSAFLARYPSEVDLEERLVDLVEGTTHKATEGFCRQEPRAVEKPGLDPTWISVVPFELFDRLEGAGLVRRDEKENQWVWTFEWFAALLGLKALKRGTAEAAAERLESWLTWASSTASVDALSLLAEERFEERRSLSLAPFRRKGIGISALAGAVALRAPIDESDGGAAPGRAAAAADLAAFAALLDRLFGLSHTLGPASDKLRVAQVLDRAEMRLRPVEGVAGARKLLRRRLVEVLDSGVTVAPRDQQLLRSLGKALVANAEADSSTVEARDDCSRALDVAQRLGALARGAAGYPWLRNFLCRVCDCAVQLPQQGDPAHFAALYAAAYATLTGLPEDPSSGEEELRQRVMLVGRAIDLKWESSPGDTVAAFEKVLELIERLHELNPAERRYLEGKQEVLAEFACQLDGTDPARAQRLRAEAAQLAGEPTSARALEVAVEQHRPGPSTSMTGSEPKSPYITTSRGELLEAITKAWRVARADPVAAIAAAQRIVETLFRNALLHEMGRPPGKPSHEDIVKWLHESRILPERFRHQLVVLEWHVGVNVDELSRHGIYGSAPGVICCAAMTRLARWYFEVYLQAELPAELDGSAPPGALLGALKLRLISSARPPATATFPIGARRRPAGRSGQARIGAVGAGDIAELGGGGLHPAQEAAARELGVPPTLQDLSTGMAMVLVPGGEVWVEAGPVEGGKAEGERPCQRVHVRPFYCAVAPVLQEVWSLFAEHNPSLHQRPRLPVANLSWEEVQAFLAHANEGRSGPPLRLLREAEWFRAARAGSDSAYWWGSEYRPGWANCSDDGMGSGRQETSEPGQYPANPFGILDSFGNVWEWCQPSFSPAIKNVRAFGAARESEAQGGGVLCGASWKSFPSELFRARHMKDTTSARFEDFGFRCGREVE